MAAYCEIELVCDEVWPGPFQRPCATSEAPAGHRVGLGHAVDRQRALIEIRRVPRPWSRRHVMGEPLVGQHMDMGMAVQHRGEREQVALAPIGLRSEFSISHLVRGVTVASSALGRT